MAVVVVYVLVLLVAGVVTALKGKWVVLALGLVVGIAWLFGALRLAKPGSWWARRYYSEEKRERARRELPRRLLLGRLGGVASLALLAGVVGTVKHYRIPSAAMEPTLHCPRPGLGCDAARADRVLAVRLFGRSLERGDIVAFRLPRAGAVRCGSEPDAVFVHRVIGLPGERIEGREGTILVNGELLSQLYAPGGRGDTRSFPPRRIPADHYFVLGDNRGASCDSRVWGALPADRLVAEVVAIYWPPGRVRLL